MCLQVAQARTRANDVYCLLDAAALVSTSELDLSNASSAPDFTALSCYKIFGYPDLGALIIKRSSSRILLQKKYFGGGTVDMLTTDHPWHMKKPNLHEALEEGTLPFHNIIALNHALSIHANLYGSTSNVSRHARYVCEEARSRLQNLRHPNDTPACVIYGAVDSSSYGPVVAFNLLDIRGNPFRNFVVEHFAIAHKIALRVGGMCNAGGIQSNLGITYRDMRRNYDAGVRCGDDRELPEWFEGAIGMVRISFGAMSSLGDVERLLEFVLETFVGRERGDAVFDGAAIEESKDNATTETGGGMSKQRNERAEAQDESVTTIVSDGDDCDEKAHKWRPSGWKSHLMGCF